MTLLDDLKTQLKSGLQYLETMVGQDLSQTQVGQDVIHQVTAQQVNKALPVIIIAAVAIFFLGRAST